MSFFSKIDTVLKLSQPYHIPKEKQNNFIDINFKTTPL